MSQSHERAQAQDANEQSGASLLDPDIQECPWPLYKTMREGGPIYIDPKLGTYVISRYDDVREALGMHDVLSSQMGMRAANQPAEALRLYEEAGFGEIMDTMVTNDPPSHTRYRALVDKAFTLGRVKKMQPYIEDLVNDLIDGFIEDGQADIAKQFSMPLPMSIIADQIGVSRDDIAKLKAWTDASVATIGLDKSPEELTDAARLVVEFQRYFADRLEERRQTPRDDMLTDLLNARVEGERPLDTKELLSIIQQLLVGGNETTTNALSAGVLLLIQYPDQADRLREDPSLYLNMANEILRLEAPVQGLFRMAREDVEIGGATIPKGSLVHLRFGSANRDEAKFEESEAFDVCRQGASKHLAFGGGIHHCIGQQLARRELMIGLRAINERLANMQLACDERDLRHVPHLLMRGFDTLPITFQKRA